MAHDDLVRREFARQAETFEDARVNAAFTAHLERLVDFAAPSTEDVCLDVACGTGLVARALGGRVRHVNAFDLTPEMLAVGKAAADAEGVTNVVFLRGDATDLPFLDGSFSLVVTRFSLHQVSAPERVVRELVRVCRPGGRVVVADLLRGPGPGDPDRVERLRDPSHGRMLTAEAVAGALADAGAAVTATDVFPVERPLRTWLAQARTPVETGRAIAAQLRAELAGGPPTGMRPLLVDDRLWFTQTWGHFFATMQSGRKA
ncbi:putative methyltransferase YcgJ [Virgisporangium aliadipatigenens]|uniref:Putative methyltransferase YcgJ n=1 Tax=Virgisporangium aliadipatigenens TaxID=741659 RepID=A0A8J4DSF5_9ACTN|nr:methyltransferase domain-containing protein [Virgisporangium aliadipatigenens]GIJ49180.1 putative methyltransferase YcgJ [Virgisporangium aliadipatigenens]